MTDLAAMDSLLWVIANTDALVTSVAHGPDGAPGLTYLVNRKLEYAWETLQTALYYHDPDFFIWNLAVDHHAVLTGCSSRWRPPMSHYVGTYMDWEGVAVHYNPDGYGSASSPRFLLARALWVATHWEPDAVPPAWATLQASLERAVQSSTGSRPTGGDTK